MEISLLYPIIAVVVLLIFSAFFSGSETALTAASSVRMHALEKEGNKRARMVNKIRDQKERMIGALLLGNNMVNILASALATSVLIKMFGETGVIYATFVMTLVVLIFAEVLPKTYAFSHADSMAMRVAPIMRGLIYIFAPVTEAVSWIVRQVLKLFGVDLANVMAGSHLELLRGVIEMHTGPEEDTQEQRAMLRSILELSEVEVEDIMIHRKSVTMLNINEPVTDIVEQVLDSPYTRLPLWKDHQDNIVGVLHAKLLLRELRRCEGKVENIDLTKVMMEPWFIPDTTALSEQLQAFRERREHFAVVVDEYGSFMGIVTLEDILEEIVGEIDDEHDETIQGVRILTGNRFMVDGSVTIRDLNREYEWGLPDVEYSTLAGLILYESKMIPEVGQSFNFHNFRFDIIKRQKNQITLIRVIPPILEDDQDWD